ncbi:MAG TPA: hypothetical protein PKX93_05925 [bacterium]|nr:hypothetical protein [bacterium]HOL66978.1 hypothetical protein [bacterium]HPP12161.1 hypothetical protein [bacterium]
MPVRRFLEQLAVVVILQLLLTRVLNWYQLGPLSFFVWVLLLGWWQQESLSIIMGFATGLLYDFLVRGTPGWSSLLMILVAYFNGYFPHEKLMERVAAAVVFGLFYSAALAVDTNYGLVWQGGQVIRFSLCFAGLSGLLAVFLSASGIASWNRKNYW